MNMNTAAKQVYLTIYYDYVDGHPNHMEEVKPVWLDAAQCGTSEISGRSAGSKFDFGIHHTSLSNDCNTNLNSKPSLDCQLRG
jgi:hypothetical protein